MGILQNILNSVYQSTLSHNVPPTAPVAPRGVTTVDSGYAADSVTPGPAPTPAPVNAGVMQTLAGLLAPEAGSFWQSATQNGLLQAKAGQQAYQEHQQIYPLDLQVKRGQAAEAPLDVALKTEQVKHAAEGDTLDPTGAIVHRNDDGTYREVYKPTPNPTETERLIEKWRALHEKDPANPMLPLIEQAIKGYASSPAVLAEKSANGIKAIIARARANAQYRKPTAAPTAKLPTGAVLD